MHYHTVLFDTSVIGHNLYRAWFCQQPKEEFIATSLAYYNQLCFSNITTDKILWVGDGKPYFRKLILSVYKSNRPAKTSDLSEFLAEVDRQSNALIYTHFEADDLIAAYTYDNPEENILIVTVDSDLLQLLRPQTETTGVVDWMCAKGYVPQFRSLRNGSLATWLTKKFSLSKKRLQHLDPTDPSSIIEWKVIMGDKSDTLLRGEADRCLIDLANPPSCWDFRYVHPEFQKDCEKMFLHQDTNTGDKTHLFREYTAETGSTFPTNFCYTVPNIN